VSTRIALAFREAQHPFLYAKNIDLKVVRLIAGARFKKADGWTEPHDAIVDTGAPLSVIPESIWRYLKVNPLGFPPRVIGLAGDGLKVEVAEVQCLAVDEKAVSSPFALRAYLSHGNSTLLLLGMEDFLTRCALHCDYETSNAYLEFP